MYHVEVKYDTLFPVNQSPDTFAGKTYDLRIKGNAYSLIIKNAKGKGILKLKGIDSVAMQERTSRHNYFYYMPYETAMAAYARSIDKQNKIEYEAFSNDREELYKKAEELSIEDFRVYFDAFVKKYQFQ